MARLGMAMSLLLGLWACATNPVTKPEDRISSFGGTIMVEIIGHEWTVEAIGGNSLIGGSRASLFFDGEAISGFAGCNRFRADYVNEGGGRISITDVVTTRMACDRALMEQESTFLDILENVQVFGFSGSYALILMADVGYAIRARRPEPPEEWEPPTARVDHGGSLDLA